MRDTVEGMMPLFERDRIFLEFDLNGAAFGGSGEVQLDMPFVRFTGTPEYFARLLTLVLLPDGVSC